MLLLLMMAILAVCGVVIVIVVVGWVFLLILSAPSEFGAIASATSMLLGAVMVVWGAVTKAPRIGSDVQNAFRRRMATTPPIRPLLMAGAHIAMAIQRPGREVRVIGPSQSAASSQCVVGRQAA